MDKPNVTLVYDNLDGYTTSMFYERALSKITNLTVLGQTRQTTLPKNHQDLAIIMQHPGWQNNLQIFTKLTCKKLFYLIDAHIDYNGCKRYLNMINPDFIYAADLKYVNKLNNDNFKTKYLPLAFDPETIIKKDIEKKYDIGFVGSIDPKLHPERRRILLLLKEKYRVSPLGNENQLEPKDMWKRLCASKIGFNYGMDQGANIRVFETLGHGILLLQYGLNGKSDSYKLFKDKKHCVHFNNDKDLIELIDYYLDNVEETNKIASAGYKEVLEKHTYNHRVKQIIKECL